MVSAAICGLVIIFAAMYRMNCLTSVLLFAVGLLLTVACSRNYEYPRELTTADSLTNVNRLLAADSLLRIYSGEAMKAGEPVRMYYQLLRLRTDDKMARYPKSDSLALSLVDYYEHRGDKRLLPKAYYYAGRTYKELNNYPQALDYMQKALDAQKYFYDKSIATKIYSQMGYIFKEQHLDEKAFSCFFHALEIDSIAKDTAEMVYNYRDIGQLYYLNSNDSSIIFHKKALSLAEKINHSFLITSVHMCMAAYYERKDLPGQAYEHILQVLDHVNQEEKGSTYIVAGKIYEKMGRPEIAATYYNEVLKFGGYLSKSYAYWRLSHIAQEKGEIEKALNHIDHYRECHDSVLISTATEAIALANSSYNYQIQEKAKNKAEKENSRKLYVIIFLVFSLFILLLLCYAMIERYKRKKIEYEQRLKELNTVLENKKKENEDYIEANRRIINELNEKIKIVKDEYEVKLLEQQRISILAENNVVQNRLDARNQKENEIRESSIFRILKSKAKEEKTINSVEIKQLETVIEKIYPQYIPELFKIADMNSQELLICLLTKAGFKPLEISKLTSHSPQAISTSRKRLYKKIFGKEGSPNDWDEYIKSIVS